MLDICLKYVKIFKRGADRMFQISNSWYQLLKQEFDKPYFLQLQQFLTQEYNTKTIYPATQNVFNALNCTKYQDIKVVIIGQDPYHQPNQAHGMAFSVQDGIKLPPSLQNIFKEIQAEQNIIPLQSGNLTRWAKQGVLLLNTVLTVQKDCPNSHKNKGWEQFTQAIIAAINKREDPVVFLLWGANARALASVIDSHHYILQSAHPSPLSAYNGFFGCGHFAKTNQILTSLGKTPIDWR